MVSVGTLGPMRLLKKLVLLEIGAWLGMAAAAAFLKRALPSRGDGESDELSLVAIFDGIDLENRASAFRGGSMLAWFGGISVDLREAQLEPGARLRVNAMLGGVAIRIPDGWRVESRAKALLGGVDVRSGTDDPAAPLLVLEGTALFGGIAVAAKKSTVADRAAAPHSA